MSNTRPCLSERLQKVSVKAQSTAEGKGRPAWRPSAAGQDYLCLVFLSEIMKQLLEDSEFAI